jgi:hypothetical protein
MLTPETFFGAFELYNTTWLPLLLLLWITLIICTFLVFARPGKRVNALMKACLAFIFGWNGIIFFFMYMKMSALPGGIPMIGIALLFAVDLYRNTITFGIPEERWQKYVVFVLIVWALGLYTLTGWLTGHVYPGGPLPVAPCPMTIFAIALLSTSIQTLRTNRCLFTLLFILLLWWSFFAGIGAPFIFGFYVDLTLLATGIYGVILLVRQWRV